MECDVQVSSDGVPFVFHDDTLDRLTAEQGPVRSRSADMLDRVLLKGTEESPPRLSTLLEQIGGRAPLLSEIKAPVLDLHSLFLLIPTALAGYCSHDVVRVITPPSFVLFWCPPTPHVP